MSENKNAVVINTDKDPVRDLLSDIAADFQLKKINASSYSGLPLAFIGDGIYEMVIRTLIISEGNMQVNKMHRRCSELVKAGTQSAMIQAIFDRLTEEEQAVSRRGHNTKPHTKAKNASTEEYLWATGFEALCGWLYLSHQQERLFEVIRMGLEAVGKLTVAKSV